jgi:transcriptional regulator GlxA family with amidase domain
MIHVSILVPEDAVLASVDDPRHLFTEVNAFLVAQGQPPVFVVQLVGLSPTVLLHKGRFTVHTDRLLPDVKQTDLIIVPALKGDMAQALAKNRALLPWIIAHYQNGAEVASLCVGVFLLAATGLLRDKPCSTNWALANEFRAMFPDVKLVCDKIITQERGLYTSGGANSYWNLLLYFVEKHAGREMAVLCAKVFQIDMNRSSQSPFIMFKGQQAHDDEPIKRVQAFIEHNVGEKIMVDQLADEFALSRRNLERRFKKATAYTVADYIQRVKIEVAKTHVETTRKPISEIMDAVGYSDPQTFRDVFKRIAGLSPVDYRNRYSRKAIDLPGITA